MGRAARGLRGLVGNLDLLATSPLTRALQTARIVADAFGGPTPVEVDALAGGDRQEVLDWLREQGEPGVAALVGHEPYLTDLISWLLSNQSHGFVELKKGAACLLAFPGPLEPGAARLRWALPPRALRGLAEAGSEG
jgi:phosphohistidine phosphatase